MEYTALLKRISPPSVEAGKRARERWDGLAKPLGSLGLLEDALVRIAALTGSESLDLSRRALLVFCADNGVVRQGVTQCSSDVTASVAIALAEDRSTVNPMARLAKCEVYSVDMGMLDFPGAKGVISCRIGNGTADITQGAAMGREDCISAICAGAGLVEKLAGEGVRIFAAGEMGIGNTTTGSAVASVLLGVPPEKVIGRGAGLSDEGLVRKTDAVKQAIQVNAPDAGNALDVLAKLGGYDIAAMCGAFLGGAACRVPVLVDGMISAVAALCAVRLCPDAAGALLASHVSAEPSGKMLLDAIGLKPLIAANMRLGEGSGAVAALPLLDMALAVYQSGQTFQRLGIDAYTPQN